MYRWVTVLSEAIIVHPLDRAQREMVRIRIARLINCPGAK